MAALNPASLEDLEDLALDLQHDLGKYVRLPVAMLPKDCDDDALRAAVIVGVRHTRRSPRGVRSAEEIWKDAQAEAGSAMDGFGAWRSIGEAVGRALDLGARAEAGTMHEGHAEALDVLSAVADATRTLLREVRDGA